MAFGPESTNPRERRAYAHAMLAKARATGSSVDLAKAEQAIGEVGDSRKSRDSKFGDALIGAALSDYSTKTIVRIAREVLDPELTPRKFRVKFNDDYHGVSAYRFTPGYFNGNSRLLPLRMGRKEWIDSHTGQLTGSSELFINAQGYENEPGIIIPTDTSGKLDILAIGKIPDRRRFDIARLAGTIVALDPRPETDLPTEEDMLEVVDSGISVNA